MIVYHGTAQYNLENFIQNGARVSLRLEGEDAFCTSLSFEEAAYFALRHTPLLDMAQTGIVLEFDAHRLQDNEYKQHTSRGCLRDEKELRIFNPEFLFLRYYYTYAKGIWIRHTPQLKGELDE